MGKDPAFLFYPGDYLGGTMGFTYEMHGAYLIMLLYQFNNGPFSQSEAISLLTLPLWNKVYNKFKTDGELYWNERMVAEVERRSKYSASRRKNIGERWSKNDKPLSGKKIDNIHMNNICNTHVIHMETRNKTSVSLKEGGVGEEKIDTWKTSFEIYRQMVVDASSDLLADHEEIKKQQEFYPNVDIPKSIEKAVHNFWGTEAGWKNKKSKNGEPNMKRTLINAIEKSKVYKNTVPMRQEQQTFTPAYHRPI